MTAEQPINPCSGWKYEANADVTCTCGEHIGNVDDLALEDPEAGPWILSLLHRVEQLERAL